MILSFIFEELKKQLDKQIIDKKKIISIGSGFLISKDGYIATNYHVIEDALEISIQELAAMPDDAFTEWLAKLENTKRTAAEIVDLPDDTWMQLDDGTDRSDDLLFRPLRIEELP